MHPAKIRRLLDHRLSALRTADATAALTRPAGGWVRAVREALGMSSTDLARRLGVTAAAVSKMEDSERESRVRLDTLAKAAHAMECDLVYSFVPRESLEETAWRRAREVADRRLRPVRVTMALEAQSVTATENESAVEELARQLLDRRDLWREHA